MVKKLTSVFLTLCIAVSMFPISAVNTSAGAVGFFKDVAAEKLLETTTRVLSECCEELSEATEKDGLSVMAQWVFMDAAEAAVKKVEELCEEILDRLDEIEEEMVENFAVVEKMLGEQKTNDAKAKLDSQWNQDVEQIIQKNNAERSLELYLEYMQNALAYSDQGLSGSELADAVQPNIDNMIMSFQNMYDGTIPIDKNNIEGIKSIVFEDTSINRKFENMIESLANNLVKSNSTSVSEYAAQFAYSYYAYSHEQYSFVDTYMEKQITYLQNVELLYNEYLYWQGEYLKEKYGADSAQYNGYLTSQTNFYNLMNNGDTSVNAKICNMLDYEMTVDPIKNIKMSLDDYMKPEDVQTTTLQIQDYTEYSHYYYNKSSTKADYCYCIDKRKIVYGSDYSIPDAGQYYGLAHLYDGAGNYVQEVYINPGSSSSHSAYKDYESRSKYIPSALNFNKVSTVTSNGIEVYYLLDVTQFSSDDATRFSAMDYKFDVSAGYDTHNPSTDYFNLSNRNISDGANSFACTNDMNKLGGLFDTNVFTLKGSKPAAYLSEYLPSADIVYLLAPKYLGTDDQNRSYSTKFGHIWVVDTNEQVTTGEPRTHETSLDCAQPGKGDNRKYSAVLVNNNEEYKQNVHLKKIGADIPELKLVSESGSVTVGDGESAPVSSGEMISIKFKLEDAGQFKSLKLVRDSNVYSEGGETETVLVDGDDISLLAADDEGFYSFDYPMPYTDATFILDVDSYDGSKSSFDISNADELINFANAVNSGYVMATGNIVADIDLKGFEGRFVPIGTESNPFKGIFNGNGHTISGLKLTSGSSNIGFFGQVSGAEISDFTIKGDISLSSEATHIGGVVANSDRAKISNVSSYVNISNSDCALIHIGGIVGSIASSGTVVDRCAYYGSINISDSHDCIGGIVGYSSNNGYISNCANHGEVNTLKNEAYTGGILGYSNSSSVTIKDCYNYGKVNNVNNSNFCGAIGGWIRACGSVSNNYYLEGSSQRPFGSQSKSGLTAEAEKAEEFSSGSVAYLLNSGVTDGTQAWYQNIDNGSTPSSYPVFDGGTVYYGYIGCYGHEKKYSNYQASDTAGQHVFNENGFCANCGEYQPATKNSEGVYEIDNGGQLFWFASLVNGNKEHADFESQNKGANAVLTADISLENRAWTPIGCVVNNNKIVYSGNFDGMNHTITGLNIPNASSYSGLFGYINGGKVYNLTLDGNVVTNDQSNDYIAGVVGYIESGTVSNVSSYVNVTGYSKTGGIVGENSSANIEKCSNYGTIIGYLAYTGGIAGFNSATLDKCCNYGSVSTPKYAIGGIAGKNYDGWGFAAVIRNCCNAGDVSSTYDGRADVGGIAGDNYCALIENCINIGKISGVSKGFYAVVGVNESSDHSIVKNSYYLNTCGAEDSLATAKTEEQFASGEVAYLLNSQITDGSQVWYQNLDNGKTPDSYPKFEGGTVYYLDYNDSYSNTYSEAPKEPDEFEKDESGNLIIKTYDDLVKLAQLVSSSNDIYGSQNYILMNNIKADDNSEWTQGIGDASANMPFNGCFDGNGYCIIGLNVKASEYGGLFGMIGEKGCVKDLFVIDCDFTAYSKSSGGIAAVNNGTIDHCISGVNFTSGTIYIKNKAIDAASYNSTVKGELGGGIAAENNGLITGCRNSSVISGKQCGGIAGENNGKIYGCASNGKTGGTDAEFSGGLAGKNSGTIESSYSSASVKGKSEETTGSIAGSNGSDGAETPIIKNVYYSTANGLNAVGTASDVSPDATNKAISKNSDFKNDSLVNELNSVSDDTIVWMRNSLLNKGYPVIKGNFYKFNVISAGNNISVKGRMHKDLNIRYDACNEKSSEYSFLSNSSDKYKILQAYSVSLYDKNENYIPAELWCQGDFEITVPVDSSNIQLAGIDVSGNTVCYLPDSVIDGMASFTVAYPMSFAIVECESTSVAVSSKQENRLNVNSDDKNPIQTGTKVFSASLIIAMLSCGIIIFTRRRNKIGKD